MDLELILKPQKLNGGTHDALIKKIKSNNLNNPNILDMFVNAYYKIGKYEGDIDLLQVLFNYKQFNYVENYKEIPVNDSKLLLFEMKSCHSRINETKAISQLKKSKSLIMYYSEYQNIDCFYCFGVGKGYIWNEVN
jgi:hypothetical protein